MIKAQFNFYFTNKKISDFESSTYSIKDGEGGGVEKDIELENHHKSIIPVLEKMLNKDSRIDNKGFRWVDNSGKKPKPKNVKNVYFIEIDDARWLESGSFKGDVSFKITKCKMNSFEFKRIGQTQVKDDNKALARPDKE